ncbi:MAG TPA: chromate efflux transporter [Chitinophagaceae bacterium]|nr:chromate efflux transporter [Chitinophagaceae bacterium]
MSKTPKQGLFDISMVCLRLGCIGFGGIAGMVSLIESEIVSKRRWISRDEYLDAVSAANLIPGPNSVEIIMHCAHEKGGKPALVAGGLCYILPSMVICLLWAVLYTQYGHLPAVQPFLYGIAPATIAVIIKAVFKLSGSIGRRPHIIFLSVLVLAGALCGINEVALLFIAAIAGALFINRKKFYSIFPAPFLFVNASSPGKLFFIFLKIGAILYGSGYVLFAYLDDALVQHNHWLTRQQLTDAISAGQLTPGPILSSATFAGYLIQGTAGALLATAAIFLPSFFIAFFLSRILRFINRHKMLRDFLDVANGASVALIAAVALRMLPAVAMQWQTALIFGLSLVVIFFTKINTGLLIISGGVFGYLLCLL